MLMIGWNKTLNFKVIHNINTNKSIENPVFISIVVVMRNESANILSLLEDVSRQNYPKNHFELIIIDDFSEDNSKEIVLNFAKNSVFKIILLDNIFGNNNQKNIISPKKRAITQAISKAQGEIIMCTDADCGVKPTWLTAMADFYAKNDVVCVSAPVYFAGADNIFEKMQVVEFASLVGSGAASLGLNMPNMCNGANFSYKKMAFLEVSGYEGVEHLISGDDEFLMHKIAAKFPKKVAFLRDERVIVHTQAQKTLKYFINQRKRWASKWQYYEGFAPKILAIFVFLLNLMMVFSGVMAFFDVVFLVPILIRFCLEFVFLSQILYFFGEKNKILYIPITFLIYPFYVIFIGIISQKKQFSWKNRNF